MPSGIMRPTAAAPRRAPYFRNSALLIARLASWIAPIGNRRSGPTATTPVDASLTARANSSRAGSGRPWRAAIVRIRSPARAVNQPSSAVAVSSVAPVPNAGDAATTPAAAPAAPTSRANESVSAFTFSGRIRPGCAAARLTAASQRLLETSSIVPRMPAVKRSRSAASTRADNFVAQRPTRSAYVTATVSTRRGSYCLGMHVDGHAGHQTIAALGQFGVDVMFTLNGGHIWPFYEAARERGVRIVDTRHEGTATFAAEA